RQNEQLIARRDAVQGCERKWVDFEPGVRRTFMALFGGFAARGKRRAYHAHRAQFHTIDGTTTSWPLWPCFPHRHLHLPFFCSNFTIIEAGSEPRRCPPEDSPGVGNALFFLPAFTKKNGADKPPSCTT